MEGGEGSGKSSLLPILRKRLTAIGISCVVTREPGGSLELPSPVCQELRRCLIHQNYKAAQMVPMTELLVFLAARAQNIAETIEPALAIGRWVLCDRFADSTIAYQGGARRVPKRVIEQLSRLACGTCEPDFTLLLDLDPVIGLARAQKKGAEFDRMESEALEFHQRVRKEYAALAESKPGRITLIDAAQPLELVSENAWKIIRSRYLANLET